MPVTTESPADNLIDNHSVSASKSDPHHPSTSPPTNAATSTATSHTKARGKKKNDRNKWTKVSVQIEYSDDHNPNRTRYSSLHSPSSNAPNLSTKNSSITDLRNYAFAEQYDMDPDEDADAMRYMDIESMVSSNISHSSTKNLKQLTRNSIYKATGCGLGDNKFRPSPGNRSTRNQSFSLQSQYSQRRRRRKKSRYSITDIFATNSSFVLDHEYNEEDICNLILSNSAQSQTKIKFLQSIWPHVLRVTTRVLSGSKFRCPICLDEEIFVGRITECGHCFCGSCLLHHLWAAINNQKRDDERCLVPKIRDGYNFSNLFGHCPLCHEYVNFDQTRPLTVIRCHDYKPGDTIDMVLIERIKGQQPAFSPKFNGNTSISTFRKFEAERYELEKSKEEISEIERAIKSADPIYEAPFLRLLAVQVEQYSAYISNQRHQYHIEPSNLYRAQSDQTNAMDSMSALSIQPQPIEKRSYSTNSYLSGFNTSSNPQRAQQRAIQLEQEQEENRYRKKKYVFQSADGQLIFLHQHNYNMLKHEVHHDFEAFPPLLAQCKILEIEHVEQSYDLRRKYPFLGFIPVDVSFTFCELDFSNVVSAATNRHFEKQTLHRQRHRVEQEKILKQEMERQKVMEEQRVALQKQKYMSPQIDIHDLVEFPSLSNDAHAHPPVHDDQSKEKKKSPILTAQKEEKADGNGKSVKSTGQKSWSQMLTLQRAATVDGPYLTPHQPTKVAVSQQTVPLDDSDEQMDWNGNESVMSTNANVRGKKRRRRRRGKTKKGNDGWSTVIN